MPVICPLTETAQDLTECRARILDPPVVDPLVGANERDLRPSAGSEAQRARERGRREEVSPRRRKPFTRPRSDSFGDLLGELVAGDLPAIEDVPGRLDQLIDLLLWHVRDLVPHRPAMIGDRRSAAIHIGSSPAGSKWSVPRGP